MISKDKEILLNDNITDDHKVTNEISMEEPNIQTNMKNKGKYNTIYPSLYLEYIQSGKDLKQEYCDNWKKLVKISFKKDI